MNQKAWGPFTRTRLTILFAVSSVAMLGGGVLALTQDRAFAGNVPVPRSTADPMKVIYYVPGVFDDGAPSNTGVATSFHCTNFSAVTERLSFVVRGKDGTVLNVKNLNIPPANTLTASTKATNVFNEDLPLDTGETAQGVAVIRSTSINVVCSAMIINAASGSVDGVALHMVRFNALPGSQE